MNETLSEILNEKLLDRDFVVTTLDFLIQKQLKSHWLLRYIKIDSFHISDTIFREYTQMYFEERSLRYLENKRITQ